MGDRHQDRYWKCSHMNVWTHYRRGRRIYYKQCYWCWNVNFFRQCGDEAASLLSGVITTLLGLKNSNKSSLRGNHGNCILGPNRACFRLISWNLSEALHHKTIVKLNCIAQFKTDDGEYWVQELFSFMIMHVRTWLHVLRKSFKKGDFYHHSSDIFITDLRLHLLRQLRKYLWITVYPRRHNFMHDVRTI